MKKQSIYFLAVVLCVMLTGCYDLAELVHGPKPIPVERVILTKKHTYIAVDGVETFTVTVLPSNASQDVEWYTHDESIVDIRGDVVIGRGKGITFITVTSKANKDKSDSCTVTVSPTSVSVKEITLKDSTTLPVNGMEIVSPVFTPDNATNQNVTWTSSDTTVATVSSAGVITTKTQGTAVITVTADGDHTATLEVNVNNNATAVSSVSLNGTTAIIDVGGAHNLVPTVMPSGANQSVLWSTSNPAIATVSQSGFVVGNAAGTATITATTAEGGKSATCAVTVRAVSGFVQVTDITLNKTSTNILAGGTETLTATVLPNDATNKNVSWTSTNSSIARVSSNGVVTAVSNGTATITAITADGNKTATCTVNVTSGVTNIPVTGVTLKQSTSLSVGGSETLYANVLPSDATNKSVTWISSNTSVATVSSSGYVYASSAGSATITVATLDGNYTAACYVTVSAVVNPNQTPVASDYDITDLSQVYNGSPKVVSITPKAGKSTGAITIYYNNNTTAPSAVGNYTITFDVAAATGWQAVSGLSGGTLSITSSSIPVTGVTLKPTTSITAGNTETLIANITPSDATNKSVLWESSDTAVATVSGGTVTAVSAGSANITVTTVDGGFSATCAVTVTATDIAVTLNSVTANGSASQTTTALTLTFSETITGLSAADITLSGVSGVVKGALTGSNPYTLAISGFTAGGTLSVAVAKEGYTITDTPKTVTIYFVAPVTVVTPSSLASHLTSLSTNTVSTPHNITLKVTSEIEFSTIRTALNGATDKYVYLDLTGSTITAIPNDAFRITASFTAITLTGINIPIGFTSIGEFAFYRCSSLAIITIPSSVTYIGQMAFCYCISLTSATLPNGVTSIGYGALGNCTSLTSINIPSSVTSIEAAAFENCTSLTSINIPSSVTSIGEGAFLGCTKLSTINIDAGNNSYTSENGVLYNKSKTSLHTYLAGKTDTFFTVPYGVIIIENRAFSSCTNLKSVIIPSSVTHIGGSAFSSCTSLTIVTIPSGVTSIENSTFYRCASLISVNIPDSITRIGHEAFRYCPSLASVIIPESVTIIGDYAFYGCTELTSVEFKGSIPSSGFSSWYANTFPGDLRDKFYATNSTNGTPGLYTRPSGSDTWTLQP